MNFCQTLLENLLPNEPDQNDAISEVKKVPIQRLGDFIDWMSTTGEYKFIIEIF